MSSRRSFRLVCTPEQIPLVEALLHAQGYAFEAEPFSPWCRRLLHEPKALGSSLAAFFGYIYIQDRSSMLPPLALDVRTGDTVLDMCASPGSKTGFLAQLTGPGGLVIGNEPDRARHGTLRQNLAVMNLAHAVTTGFPAEKLPLANASFSRILLDPPCSGWGTEERNPNVRSLWKGAKIAPLIALQRRLLEQAARILRPGGQMVYSTCTTNVDENEAQVRYALDELGLELLPVGPMPGFTREKSALPGLEATLRIDQHSSEGQGFFIAALRKPGLSEKNAHAAFQGEADEMNAANALNGPDPIDAVERVRLLPPPPGWGGNGIDMAAMPHADLAVFGETVHLVPHKAVETLPAVLRWRAMAAGKARSGSGLSPRLRCLMPPADKAEHTNAIALNMDEASAVSALLAGQSVNVAPQADSVLLYWRDLPLGRLRARKGRALWSL